MSALAAGLGTSAAGCELGPIDERTGRALRVAHMTDIHLLPDGAAVDGLAAAFRQVQGLPDPPDLILNGGDCIYDALAVDKARTAEQWDAWHRVLDAELAVPMAHCIGNHDVWGWKLTDPSLESDPLFGKAWAMQELGLTERYYAFDFGGWRFVVLDSSSRVLPSASGPRGYEARLDEAQWRWLEAELDRTEAATPICVLSHIPILSACAYFDGNNEASGDWIVPGAWMHVDARRIKDLFARHDHVKLCLSGHIHMQDRVDFLGVSYLCDGAVSGAWWEGDYYEFGPACAILDLYPDGSFEAQMLELG